MLGWEEVADVLGEATGQEVDHFKEGPDTDLYFRILVTKGKSEIRENSEGHQSHVKNCFISGIVVWKYLKT